METPITRVEQYLSAISGNSTEIPERPITRIEHYLAAILNNNNNASFTETDKQALNEAGEVSAKAFAMIDGFLSGLPYSVHKHLISANGIVKVRAISGTIDEIKVPSSYAGQTLFVARIAPVYVTGDAARALCDPNPQIQSAVVASDGGVPVQVSLCNDNYFIVVTTTDLAAALADSDETVSPESVLFSCRYTRRTNELLDEIGPLTMSEAEYAGTLGYQLVYEEISGSPDDAFSNAKNVFMYDGTNYYELQTAPSTFPGSDAFYTAKYQRLTE